MNKITRNMCEDTQDQEATIRLRALESKTSAQVARFNCPHLDMDQLSTQPNLGAISNSFSFPASEMNSSIISDMPTWIFPVVHVESVVKSKLEPQKEAAVGTESQAAVLLKLVKSSGFYALSSVATPLVSLFLAPFLTHHLSPTDYGVLAITNTAIGLSVGITQLGLASAFFRAYSYDYTSQRDRRDVIATVTALLCLISVPMAILVVIMAPVLANLLFGLPSLSNCISLAGGVILLQNLTVPGMAWLRAEGRPLFYSLLSISNLLVALIANILLIGVLHLGIPGSIIANGCGYACIVMCTIPIVVFRAGIKIRVDIARNLLAFGLPLVLNFVSGWILQLSDRYLLGLFRSLAEAGQYTIAYTLGGAMSVFVMGPFTLAWPTTLFTIARREDAAQVFKLVFRWFSLFLLFVAFGASLVATFILDWLFPVMYHSAAPVIPVVAESIVFYGVYNVFMSGANIQRKTWLTAVFTTLSALVNVALNLILIPLYGAMGAAASTLIAYIVLALSAYIINQRLYPIPFEIDLFFIALFIGAVFYIGSLFLVHTQHSQRSYLVEGISFGALVLYGGCLLMLGIFATHKNKSTLR